VERRQIGALVLAGVGVAFAVANLDEVKVNWILGTWETPLIVVIALSMIVGAALGFLVSRRRS
jgi:lipopolysaccharide assembly protein A